MQSNVVISCACSFALSRLNDANIAHAKNIEKEPKTQCNESSAELIHVCNGLYCTVQMPAIAYGTVSSNNLGSTAQIE